MKTIENARWTITSTVLWWAIFYENNTYFIILHGYIMKLCERHHVLGYKNPRSFNHGDGFYINSPTNLSKYV
jgi:hypothetical protein